LDARCFHDVIHSGACSLYVDYKDEASSNRFYKSRKRQYKNSIIFCTDNCIKNRVSYIRGCVALAFCTIAIGLSEELYFREIILRKLKTCFTIKQTVILSSVFFAAVHASQAFSGAGIIMVTLTIINALIFGVIASEIVILTRSIIPVIIWHVLYDFINWISVAKGTTEVTLIMIQSVIMVVYAYYLWTKLPEKQACPA